MGDDILRYTYPIPSTKHSLSENISTKRSLNENISKKCF